MENNKVTFEDSIKWADDREEKLEQYTNDDDSNNMKYIFIGAIILIMILVFIFMYTNKLNNVTNS